METVPSGRVARGPLERDALRLLCSDLIAPNTRMQLAGMVNERSFGEELNGVVYAEIVAVGPVSARRLRELLPGRVTLRGFPDFELKEFLGPRGADEDVDKLFESLLALTEEVRVESNKALGHSA
jgi:hypothetical protein